jgi:hypothetical protein
MLLTTLEWRLNLRYYFPRMRFVTSRGMQLFYQKEGISECQCKGSCGGMDLLGRIYFLQPWIFEQTQPRNTKDSVKYIGHVARSVRYTARFWVLKVQAMSTCPVELNSREKVKFHTWHLKINPSNFLPSIQCNRPIIARLLNTHQL